MIHVHVGQAGNQLAERLQYPSAVLIDSEPKVVSKMAKVVNSNNIVFAQNGRGNNFALGFSKSYNEKLLDDSMTAIRR